MVNRSITGFGTDDVGGEPARVVSIRIGRMRETCERTSYYVMLVTDEGFENTVECHQTGSIYTNHEGLSVEEARDRALIDADRWADFFRLPAPVYEEDGTTYKPSMTMRNFTIRRELDKKRASKG